MAAILFSSVGHSDAGCGQDFLRSKQGVNNTYLRGDLNALIIVVSMVSCDARVFCGLDTFRRRNGAFASPVFASERRILLNFLRATRMPPRLFTTRTGVSARPDSSLR